MSINVFKAIGTVFSPKYDKINFLKCLLLISIPTITLGYFNFVSSNENAPSELSFFLFYLLSAIIVLLANILMLGFYTKSTHNAIKMKKGILVDIFKNLGLCLKLGFKWLAGFLICGFIYTFALIPFWIIWGILAAISPLMIIIPIIGYIVLTLFFICYLATVNLMFANSLSFRVFLNINNVWNKYKGNKKVISRYLIHSLLFSLMALVIIITINVVLFFTLSNIVNQEQMKTIIDTISTIFGITLWPITIELAGQTGRIMFFKENEAKRKKIHNIQTQNQN